MKYSDKSHSPAIGTAIIVAVLVAFFGGVLYWMYSVRLLNPDNAIMRLLGIYVDETDNELPWDTGKLSGLIQGQQTDTNAELTFSLTWENLKSALLLEEKPEGCYQNVEITYYSNSVPTSHRVEVRKYGDRFHIDDYGSQQMTVTADTDEITYRQNGIVYTLPRDSSVTAENEAGIPSVDSLLAHIGSFSAERNQNERYSDCEITLISMNGENVYYVTWNDNFLSLTEEYYLSENYNAVISHKTYHGGTLIYSAVTVDFSVKPEWWQSDSYYHMD